MAFCHVEDDELVAVSSEFIEICRKVSEPGEDLLAHARVHVLDECTQLSAFSLLFSFTHIYIYIFIYIYVHGKCTSSSKKTPIM